MISGKLLHSILIEKLLGAGAKVKAYDPAAMNEARKMLEDNIEYAADPYEAVEGADAMALMTEWSEFHLPDFAQDGRSDERQSNF